MRASSDASSDKHFVRRITGVNGKEAIRFPRYGSVSLGVTVNIAPLHLSRAIDLRKL